MAEERLKRMMLALGLAGRVGAMTRKTRHPSGCAAAISSRAR